MPKLLTLALCSLAALAQKPAGVTVVQATCKQVQLSWTAANPAPAAYVVERRTLDGKPDSKFVALPAGSDPAAATYTDAAIAPYATYVYRVRTRLSPTALSDPSAEFTVGPPPVGLSLASPLKPAISKYALSAATNFGARLRIALDSNGDAAVLYLIYSPKEDPAQSLLEFVSWNRAAYRWNAPRPVVVSGDVLGSGAENKSLAFARDSSTGTWGVAYINGTASPRLALSKDNGETWTDSQIFNCGDLSCRQISLGLAAGKIHVAFVRSPAGVHYLTGDLASPSSSWKSQIIPKPKGAGEARASLDLALDSANVPAIAYWSEAEGYNLLLGYWRPGAATVIAMDTKNYQTDAPDVDIKFFGTKPVILGVARRTEEFFAKYDQNLWLVRGQDGGSFGTPYNLPSDGNVTLGYPSLAIGSAGQLSVSAAEVGGSGDNVRCGLMKIIEQASETAAKTVCSPLGRDRQPFTEVTYPKIIYAPNDGRYVTFMNPGTESKLPGVLVWRER